MFQFSMKKLTVVNLITIQISTNLPFYQLTIQIL